LVGVVTVGAGAVWSVSPCALSSLLGALVPIAL
jgi:hypothetical protein